MILVSNDEKWDNIRRTLEEAIFRRIEAEEKKLGRPLTQIEIKTMREAVCDLYAKQEEAMEIITGYEFNSTEDLVAKQINVACAAGVHSREKADLMLQEKYFTRLVDIIKHFHDDRIRQKELMYQVNREIEEELRLNDC